MLCWFLQNQGKKCLVIDNNNAENASRVASGVSNPITGRRFVKTWMAETLLPFAADTYQDLEEKLGIRCYEEIPILKLFDSIKSQNDWSAKTAEFGYNLYLKNQEIQYLNKTQVKNDFGAFEITGGSKLSTEVFLTAFRRFLHINDALLEEQFSFLDLNVSATQITYKNYSAPKIIFCEGAAALQNPFFKHLPFQPAKGECLVVRIPDFYTQQMINSEVFLMPLKDDLYYVGATHEWDFENDLPTESGKAELLTGLQMLLKSDFELVAHRAALRPAVKDRRPFLGLSSTHPSVGIFNGLGTKGISLAPYFAHHFVQHLVCGEPLNSEVDIQRFS